MTSKPDTIKVTASHREEISATHADLSVTVKGSSLVGGDEALKKAKEVSQLVEDLTRIGLPMTDIHLQSVYTEAASGAILKSSSATYHLRLRCTKLEQIPDLLGAIASQKNANLENITWLYPDDTAHAQALTQAVAKAQAKARSIAETLGVELLGVYALNENVMDNEIQFRQSGALVAQPKARGAGVIPQADMGLDIQHAKTIQCNVEIEFRVSAFD